MMNRDRIKTLQKLMPAYGIDMVALVPGPNMVYYANLHAHLSERPIVLFMPAAGEMAIIIPTLEAMKAEEAGIPADRVFAWSDEAGFLSAFQAAAKALDLAGNSLGVEALHMRVLESQNLLKVALGLEIVAADELITAPRLIKDTREIQTMEHAVSVAEKALQALLPRLRIGMSEKQIAAMLTQELLDAGAESVSFGPIVASGPNSAIPHAVPTDREIRKGDLLLFDWGALIDGYASDITRTFAVGELDPELVKIYETVRMANEAGKAAVGPGVAAQEIDRAARNIIEQAGYGALFFHRTGHGLGLEVHEDPSLLEGNATRLQEGNVFTVEPGIYAAGRGGVRIEDNILVTSSGCRSLTSFSRELIHVCVDT